jgi:hypothetical protein
MPTGDYAFVHPDMRPEALAVYASRNLGERCETFVEQHPVTSGIGEE